MKKRRSGSVASLCGLSFRDFRSADTYQCIEQRIDSEEFPSLMSISRIVSLVWIIQIGIHGNLSLEKIETAKKRDCCSQAAVTLLCVTLAMTMRNY